MSRIEPFERVLSNEQFLRRLVEGMTADPATQDDVVQETIVAASRLKPGQPKRLRGWLRATAQNIVRKDIRSKIRRRSRERFAARAEQVSLSPGRDLAEIRGDILSALTTLSPEQLEVVLLRFYEDMPTSQIASELDIPMGTIKSRLKVALLSVRGRLQRQLDEDFRRNSHPRTTIWEAGEGEQRIEDWLFSFYGRRPDYEYCKTEALQCAVLAASCDLHGMFARIGEMLHKPPRAAVSILKEEPTHAGRSLAVFLWLRHCQRLTTELISEMLDAVAPLFPADSAETCNLEMQLLLYKQAGRGVREIIDRFQVLLNRLKAVPSVKSSYVQSGLHTFLASELVTLDLVEPAHHHLMAASDLVRTFGFEFVELVNCYHLGVYFEYCDRPRAALALFRNSALQSMARSQGNFMVLCGLHNLAASVAVKIGDLDTARTELAAVQAIARSENLSELNAPVLGLSQAILSRIHWETGDREQYRSHYLTARRLYASAGWIVLDAAVLLDAVRFAFEDRDFEWLCDALDESLAIATTQGHLQTSLRRFFMKYVLLECGGTTTQAVYAELKFLDKIGLAHNPTLMARAMQACYADAHRKAGRAVASTSDSLLRSAGAVIDVSCVGEVYERWVSTKEPHVRSRFEDAIRSLP